MSSTRTPPTTKNFVGEGGEQISAERAGKVAVGSWALTGDQLSNILRVLEKPPRRPDWTAAILSCFGSGVLALKTLRDSGWKPEGFDVAVVTLACCLVAVTVWRSVAQCVEKDSHYEAALKDARALAESERERGQAAG